MSPVLLRIRWRVERAKQLLASGGQPLAEVARCCGFGTVETFHRVFRRLVDADIVVIPGGIITCRMARDGHPVIDWIRAVHPTTIWTTSVCTGAVLLGAAGLLDGLDAATHWIAYDQLAVQGAHPTAERVVVRGKIVTAAGVSSGIDMALTLAEKIGGAFLSQAIQLGIEYDPRPPFDAGSPAKAPREVLDALTKSMHAREAASLA